MVRSSFSISAFSFHCLFADADKLVNLSPSIGRTKSTVNLADDDEDMRKAVALSMNQPKVTRLTFAIFVSMDRFLFFFSE